MPVNRLYVIVRTDLPCSHPAVQAGHVVAEFYKDYPGFSQLWNNQTLIYLMVNTKRKLYNLMHKMDRNGIIYTYFKEPDIDDEITAIAVWMNEESTFFDKYKLYV